MHGRLKVRTTAEMQALTKKKEQEKANYYRSQMDKILAKRKEHQLDEEMLTLTADILVMNPDVATLWNIRRESLLKMKDAVEDVNAVVEKELKLTESGLRVNPKSYCAWHHRCWILDHYSDVPNWDHELKLCTKYLELDERNFHCWDYRRYVVEHHCTELEKELEYSSQKLASNFSNYSAWHYRSKLIPRIYCAFEREKLVENDIYRQEVSLVENAVYTDPNDQSAWFYHRWLLGHITNSVRIIQAGIDSSNLLAWVAVHPTTPEITVKGLGNDDWAFLNDDKFSNIFVKKLAKVGPSEPNKVTLFRKDEEVDSVDLCVGRVFARSADFKPVLSDVEKNYLNEQLESYKQLAQLEPENKWALLAMNLIKEKLGQEVDIDTLEKLKSIDKLRANYYSDLISRQKIERKLSSINDWSGSFIAGNISLTAFYHSYYFTHFQEVDLSENPLGDGLIEKLATLFSCQVLKLRNCGITSIDSFPALKNLRILDISNNPINCDSEPAGLHNCDSLREFICDQTFIPSSVSDFIQFICKARYLSKNKRPLY